MEPSRSYPILLARLKKRFEENPNRKLWLVGIVLCRPQLKIAREEIIPSLSYFNRESGKNIDFFFAGYDVKPVEDSECVPIQTGISSRPDWYFNPDEFDRVVEEIRDKTKKRYRYTGGCDLILVNCLHSETGEAWLDFSDSALAPLEVLRNQGRLPDTSHFFKSIFDYCRASNTGDPAWGFGVDAEPGSSLVELCDKFLSQSNRVENLGASRAAPIQKSDLKKSQVNQLDGNLLKGPFRYDLPIRSLILPSGIKYLVQTRYAEVLDKMFTKDDGLYSVRKSHLDFATIATLFEIGRWKEEHPDWSEIKLKKEARADFQRIQDDSKRLAQSFRQQFSRWLRKLGIDADSVVTADRKNPGYKLGSGWHSRRAVIGDSEVGLFPAGGNIENNSGEEEPYSSGQKPNSSTSDDGGYDPQEVSRT